MDANPRAILWPLCSIPRFGLLSTQEEQSMSKFVLQRPEWADRTCWICEDLILGSNIIETMLFVVFGCSFVSCHYIPILLTMSVHPYDTFPWAILMLFHTACRYVHQRQQDLPCCYRAVGSRWLEIDEEVYVSEATYEAGTGRRHVHIYSII